MIEIRVSGKQIDLGEALPLHVQSRLSAAVTKYFSGGGMAHVVFKTDGGFINADCSLNLSSGAHLQAEAAGKDPYLAFGAALEKLEKQLRRSKRQRTNHHKHAGASGLPDISIVEGE